MKHYTLCQLYVVFVSAGNTRRFIHQKLASLSTSPTTHTPRNRCDDNVIDRIIAGWLDIHYNIERSLTSNCQHLQFNYFFINIASRINSILWNVGIHNIAQKLYRFAWFVSSAIIRDNGVTCIRERYWVSNTLLGKVHGILFSKTSKQLLICVCIF